MTGRQHCPLCHGAGYVEEHYGPPHNPNPSGHTEPCEICQECYACGRPLVWEVWSSDPLTVGTPGVVPAWLVVAQRHRPHCPSCVRELEDYLGYLADATAAAEGSA